jgi:hypothetical protein
MGWDSYYMGMNLQSYHSPEAMGTLFSPITLPLSCTPTFFLFLKQVKSFPLHLFPLTSSFLS